MIYSLKGKLIYVDPTTAVVECAGVGYKCHTTMQTMRNIKLNTEVTLYTHLNVREDAMELFGFYSQAELSSFRTLIGVTGVGPKMALSIRALLPEEEVVAESAAEEAEEAEETEEPEEQEEE